MLDIPSFTTAMKQHYVDFQVKTLTYKNRPLHALLKKVEDFDGLNMPLPVIYGNPQNRSASFAVAQAGTSNLKTTSFLLTRKKDYSLASVDNETMEATRGKSGAFFSAMTKQMDGAIDVLSQSIAIAEYRNGTGSIGQVGSVSSLVITLSKPNDVAVFEVGMALLACATDGSAARAGSAMNITAVNRSAGTITVDATVAGLTAGDFLVPNGDLNAKLAGLDAWLPMQATISGTDNFLGVNRSVDQTRLAGVYGNYTAAPIDQALVAHSAQMGKNGGNPSHTFLSFENYAALENALGSKVQYVRENASGADIGFNGIRIIGTKGEIKVIADQNCQSDRFYMLDLPTWGLYSLGSAPRIFNGDSLDFLRSPSADGVDLRVCAYLQMGCEAPGWNGVGQLA